MTKSVLQQRDFQITLIGFIVLALIVSKAYAFEIFAHIFVILVMIIVLERGGTMTEEVFDKNNPTIPCIDKDVKAPRIFTHYTDEETGYDGVTNDTYKERILKLLEKIPSSIPETARRLGCVSFDRMKILFAELELDNKIVIQGFKDHTSEQTGAIHIAIYMVMTNTEKELHEARAEFLRKKANGFEFR